MHARCIVEDGGSITPFFLQKKSKERTMCKASIEVNDTRDGRKGDRLEVSAGPYGLGTAHEPGKDPNDCAVCLKTGTLMTMSGIPEDIRQALGVNKFELVTFVETPGSHNYVIHDLVKFGDHDDLEPVPFAVLAGSEIVVHSIPSVEITVEELLGTLVKDVRVTGEPVEVLAQQYGESRRAA